MPYKIRKLPKQDLYRVYSNIDGTIHSYGTTLENAKKQITLLNMIDAGVPLQPLKKVAPKERMTKRLAMPLERVKVSGKGYCPDNCECSECMIVGGALTKIEKQKLIEKIRPITKEEAVESYLDLADESSVPPPTSNKGNTFVDYFTFNERLETTGNKGITFWEFWENKSMYMKKNYVRNLLEFMNKKGEKDLVKKLYPIFKMYFGSVGIFKPVIAMNIYAKYKPTSILDFTMGWGGRLVGAAALDIPNYIGIDLNKNLEKPYTEMVKTLKELGTKTNIKLMFKDALKVDYSKLNYDMVFTSPPYYNVELYRGTNKMTEEEWNETFYKPLFSMTWEHLKTGGHYILNVPIAVYENVLVKLLGKATTILPMNTKRKKLKQAEYKEYIYVWKKTSNSNSPLTKQGEGIETDLIDNDKLGELYMKDEAAFNKYMEDYVNSKKGKGIENKISNKSIGMNSWVQYVKDYASKNGMKYNEALKDPACKAGYKSGKGLVQDVKATLPSVKSATKKIGLGKCGMGIVDEGAAAGFADQVLIADAYNQTQLGAKKKYISL